MDTIVVHEVKEGWDLTKISHNGLINLLYVVMQGYSTNKNDPNILRNKNAVEFEILKRMSKADFI
jgi:hypothetical protein